MENIDYKTKLWLALMKFGEIWGCHQMPERSFTVKGYQFPLCARCTGVLIGHAGGLLACTKLKVPVIAAFTDCFVMFADWLVQALGIKESTNNRRLVTGIIGGFGAAVIWSKGISVVSRRLTKNSEGKNGY